MRILIVGDLHLRKRRPEKRTDADFMATCLDKLGQILQIADERKADLIVQTGDFFDSAQPPGDLMVETIKLLRSSKHRIVTVHGQHDMAYHTIASIARSPLAVLEAAGLLTHLTSSDLGRIGKAYGKNGTTYWPDVYVVGACFGESPIPSDHEKVKAAKDTGAFTICIAHAMVGDEPLWPGQELPSPKAYVKKHPGYDLYCLGDYHYPFETMVGKSWVINPGCVLRTKATPRELAHHPKVVLFDTDTGEPEDIFLKITPAKDAFDLTRAEITKPEGPDFSAFVERLRAAGQVGVSFQENLETYYEQKDTPKNIRQAVQDAMDGV